jgi:hypothetical protein
VLLQAVSEVAAISKAAIFIFMVGSSPWQSGIVVGRC